MKVIPETRRALQIRYLRFYYYHWVDTSAGGLLDPDGIIRPVVSASVY
jgi:aryl-alcohol dehydrogenase-like predicted oxidoreductase